MVEFSCQICDFKTLIKCNYSRHLTTKKHLKNISQLVKNEEKNEENEDLVQNGEVKKIKKISKQNQKNLSFLEKSPHLVCQFCQKKFSRIDNLRRHISVCRLSQKNIILQFAPICTNLHQENEKFKCGFCDQLFSRKYSLERHFQRCKSKQTSFSHQDSELKIKLLEKDLEKEKALQEQQQKTLEIVSKMKPSQITNNITNNKTINYLNTNFGEMIEMEKFLYNLQYTEQLTHHEREMLLMAYKDNGIELFARSFSHIMKENCRRQLLKEGLPDVEMLPLVCSDGNLRSHKEKGHEGWKTHYDNHSINKMINISSDQVYQSHQYPLFIDGRNRKKVYKQIKQDNHAQKIKDRGKVIMDV